MEVDWTSADSPIFWNPFLSAEEQSVLKNLMKCRPKLEGHLWLTTSGTTRKTSKRMIALSKRAFLVSAEAVNAHLNSTPQDIWLNPLPLFHVGGISIYARSFLSGSKVYVFSGKWSAKRFHQTLLETAATLTSLVPTQLHDLVAENLSAPHLLRGVIVGGGGLSTELYEKGSTLQWPLMPSYGLTECCSQVATAALGNPSLRILPHVNIKTDAQNVLLLKSQALLSGYLEWRENTAHFQEPIQDEWFKTEDRGEIFPPLFLKILGRTDDLIKILGELVDVKYLENLLEQIANSYGLNHFEAILVPVKDERRGYWIDLVVEKRWEERTLQKILDTFHQKVSPIEKIRKINKILIFPRNHLGKIIKSKLEESLWES